MKTITLDIIKKNRVYFKCKSENGYEVKLKVTPKSENLNLGKQTLLVKDVSVRTKYGTDVIYDLEDEIKTDRIVTLQSRYNQSLVHECKKLGGKWDPASKSWVFSAIVEDKVEELDAIYNSKTITIEITAKEDDFSYQDAIHFCGYRLAKATGRDSGAQLCDGVALIKGSVKSSGSMKNWGTEVTSGSIFRLQVAKDVLKLYSIVSWDVKIISKSEEENHD